MQRTNFLRVIFVAFVIICYIYTSAGFLKPNEEAAISELVLVIKINLLKLEQRTQKFSL